MDTFLTQITDLVGAYVPNLIGAVLILVIGWIIALIVSAGFRAVIKKTGLDKKMMGWISGGEEDKEVPFAKYISKTIFYLIMLFVLIAFFQTLGLTIITEPLNDLLSKVFEYVPQILAAGLLLLVAWIIASLLRFGITRLLTAVKLDEKISDQTGVEGQKSVPISKTLAGAAYWLIFLLFLPAILDTLRIDGLLSPVQQMINEILTFLPNIFTGLIILLIGWFFATILRKIVTNLSAAVGVDRLSQNVGLDNVLGSQQFSGLLGLIVYVLILIPVLIAALEAMAIDAITHPAMNMLNMMFSALPALFAAVLILLISYIVGKILSALVVNLLSGIGFNKIWVKLGFSREEMTDQKTPSDFIGYIVLIAIMFFALIEAFNILKFDLLADLFAQFTVFAGQILVGIIILGIGVFFANLAANKIKESESNYAAFLSILTRIAILVLVGSMALQQMGFGEEIIVLAFGITLGAIAISFAIAFGIGGRDIASTQLKNWMETIRTGKSGK
ncbi:MAG: mechanosensitive ion channel [Calditrichaceae bacterium]